MENITTTNLTEFWFIEKTEAWKILNAYSENLLTDRAKRFFYDDWIEIMMNKNSWYVFLTNSDYQVLMLNDDWYLDLFITLFETWKEWFYDDLINDNLTKDEKTELKQYK